MGFADVRDMFKECNAQKPWWYVEIENRKERMEEVKRRKELMDLNEKMKKGMMLNNNFNKKSLKKKMVIKL